MKTDLAKIFDCSAKMGFQLHYCRDCGEAGKSRGHVLRCFSDLFFFCPALPFIRYTKSIC